MFPGAYANLSGGEAKTFKSSLGQKQENRKLAAFLTFLLFPADVETTLFAASRRWAYTIHCTISNV